MAEIAGYCADFRKDQAIAAMRIDFTASDSTMVDVKVPMEGRKQHMAESRTGAIPS